MALLPLQIRHLVNLIREAKIAYADNADNLADTLLFLKDAQLKVWDACGIEDTTIVDVILERCWHEEAFAWPNYSPDGESFFTVGVGNLLSVRKLDPISGQVTEVKNNFKEM